MSKRKREDDFRPPGSRRKYAKMWRKQRGPNLPQEVTNELDTLFNKHHKYTSYFSSLDEKKGNGAPSPLRPAIPNDTTFVESFLSFDDDSNLDWKDLSLLHLKNDVNTTKDKLSDKDIEQWHKHTTECNPAGKIIPFVRSHKVELCTQAWVKFFEIVSRFKIVPDTNFLSVHLCEAPGAFIASLNHYLKQEGFKYDWDWRATTLNPYYEGNSTSEMIPDDRLFRYTYSQCFFGLDGSGDIRAENHITDLNAMMKDLERKKKAKVLLVTADGSRDCQENPAEQEALVSELHYCEVIAACMMLAEGGNFVLKMFTMFEASSISLLFMLNMLFREVNAYKPATSKSGNSETYIVCLHYRKNISHETLLRMLSAVREKGLTCFIERSRICDKFLEEHKVCCNSIANWQILTIERNIELFEPENSEELQMVKEVQRNAVNVFKQRNYLVHGKEIQRLVKRTEERPPAFTTFETIIPDEKELYDGTDSFNFHKKNMKGSFNLRQNIKSLPFLERLNMMPLKEEVKPCLGLECYKRLEVEESKEVLSLERAYAFGAVLNSQFCNADLLADLNMMFQYSEYRKLQREEELGHARYLVNHLKSMLRMSRGPGCQYPEKAPSSGPQSSSSSSDASKSPAGSSDASRSPLSSSDAPRSPTSSPDSSRSPASPPRSPSSPLYCSPAKRRLVAEPNSPSNQAEHPPNLRPKKVALLWVTEDDKEKKSSFCQLYMDLAISCRIVSHTININRESDASRKLKDKSHIFMDVTNFSMVYQRRRRGDTAVEDLAQYPDHTEIATKKTWINKTLWALQNVPLGATLVLLTNTCLTRFTAGIVYILARCFCKTKMEVSPNLWLHQFVILEDFQGASNALIKHMERVKNSLEEEGKVEGDKRTIVEVAKFLYLLDEGHFKQFLQSSNDYLLASFINIILKHNKDAINASKQ